jgi:hypothetical protein
VGLVLAGVGCTSVVQKERECVKTRCAAIAAHTKALLNGTRALKFGTFIARQRRNVRTVHEDGGLGSEEWRSSPRRQSSASLSVGCRTHSFTRQRCTAEKESVRFKVSLLMWHK